MLCFLLSGDSAAESSEDANGVTIDYAVQGNIAGIEALNASQKMMQPHMPEHEATRAGRGSAAMAACKRNGEDRNRKNI